MDIEKAIADLRKQKDRIEQAILAFEKLAREKPRRGRPPKWLSRAATSDETQVQTQSAKV